jgi:hypothetical protein
VYWARHAAPLRYNAPVSFSHYTAFGLNISSEIEFPELLPGEVAIPQISIKYGTVPEKLTNPTARGITYEATRDQFLIRVSNIARYLISNGVEITVEPLQDTSDAVRLFLLGPVFGALLNQRGFIVLHGSAIQTKRGAVVFVGNSGAGKSTIAAGFCDRGYRILADDTCATQDHSSTELVALPAFPRLKLWRDSAQKIGLDLACLQRVRPELQKYNYPVQRYFCFDPLPLRAIYVLNPNNCEKVSIKPLKGLEKIGLIARNIVGRGYMKALGHQAEQFEKISAMAERLRISSVARPEKAFLLQELLDSLEQDWSEK